MKCLPFKVSDWDCVTASFGDYFSLKSLVLVLSLNDYLKVGYGCIVMGVIDDLKVFIVNLVH